ncbi:MAG: carboxypeptidase M32 [Candidatus Hermodarchaeota archaeon]
MTVMKELREYFTEIMRLNYIQALLGWDQEVNMRNYKSVEGRSEQRALVSQLIHKRLTSEKAGNLIKKAEKLKDLNEIDAAMLREAKRAYEQEIKLPEELVMEITKTAGLSQQTWQKAREKKDFKMFIPLLEKTVELQREKARKLETYPDLYSTLIDLYEPGATYDWVAKIFNPIGPKLSAFVKKLNSSKNKPNQSILRKNYDQEKQFKLSFEIIKKLNFDLEAGRQDLSTHPFTTTLSSTDTRITTRTREDFLNECIFGTIHECGHALYEMGFKEELHDTILGTGTSLGIHESQSRMLENFVGRSKEFWEYWYPTFQKIFPEILKDYPMEDFYRSVNSVQPSFIRVNADEVTYGLHIILRFEIEKDLIDEKIQVSELPEVWNSRFEELLGISPPDDKEGVLQDIHWGMGMIGYFPTYFLGTLYAAQMYNTALKKMPNLLEDYKKGEFSNILKFVRENIHQHGAVYRAGDLIKRVTGEDLNPDYFMKYIESKFYPIYGL